MRRDLYLRIYHYCIEGLLLYILTFIYFMHENILSPVLPFLVVVGGGALLMVGIFYITKNRSYPLIVLITLLIGSIGYAIGYRFELLVIISLFVFWRVPAHVNEADMKHEMTILGSTFFAGLATYLMSSFVDYKYGYIILALTCIQIIVVMLGRFFDGLMGSSFSSTTTTKKQIKWITVVFGSLIGSVVLLTVALPILKPTFFFLLKGLVFSFAYLLLPLLYLLLGQEELLKKFFDSQYGDGEGEAEVAPAISEIIDVENASYNPLFGWVVFAIVMCIILFIFWKKYHIRNISSQAVNELAVSSSILTEKRSSFSGNRKPPKDYVRRLFYNLERFAAKHHTGRKKDETAKEWLERIGYFENDKIVSYYETVRYEEEALSKEEKEEYDKIVKDIKRMIKANKQ